MLQNFTEEAYLAYSEGMEERYDFGQTCARKDGSKYGTAGQCRKGSPTQPSSKEELQKRASKGDRGAMGELNKMRSEGKIGKEKGYSPGNKARQETLETKKRVTELDKQAKAANKEADKLDAKWRKGGMKDKKLQAEVKAADKKAKELDKKADAAAKINQQMDKANKANSAAFDKIRALKKQGIETGPKIEKARADLRKAQARQDALKEKARAAGLGVGIA